MAQFQVGDAVKKADGSRVNGIVKYIACVAATKNGGGTCDKKTCNHQPQEYVWVDFQGKVFSYHETELAADVALAATTPEPPPTEKELVEKLSEQLDKAEKQIKEEKFDFTAYNSTLPGSKHRLRFF